jgi:hypothetical protein
MVAWREQADQRFAGLVMLVLRGRLRHLIDNALRKDQIWEQSVSHSAILHSVEAVRL